MIKVPAEVANNCLYKAIMGACKILDRVLDEVAHRELCKLIQEQEKPGRFLTDCFDDLPKLLASIGPFDFAHRGGIIENLKPNDLIILVRQALCEADRDLSQTRQYHVVLGFVHELGEQLQNHSIILAIRFRNR